MVLKKWEDLPEWMKNDEVWNYYKILEKKKISLRIKRWLDVIMASAMLIILSPVFLIVAVFIVIDSPGGVFYRQVRVTAYGKKFKIHKFRTMVADADKLGSQITIDSDHRITKIGTFIRKYRLDEFPQLLDILAGTMSFVGTRPEVPRYVKHYTPKMRATLLLPAGVTSEASIQYKEEAKLLESAENLDDFYIKKILPEKMKYNLNSIRNFNLSREILTMFKTVLAVLDKAVK